jgi:hypothetical protein
MSHHDSNASDHRTLRIAFLKHDSDNSSANNAEKAEKEKRRKKQKNESRRLRAEQKNAANMNGTQDSNRETSMVHVATTSTHGSGAPLPTTHSGFLTVPPAGLVPADSLASELAEAHNPSSVRGEFHQPHPTTHTFAQTTSDCLAPSSDPPYQ